MRHVKTTTADPGVLVGLETPDDAGVYLVAPDVAIVQTVDFFTPIVDDPFTWGRIAAVNAMSDVYAMGARPVTALNLVGWPRSLDFEILGQVIEGGAAACEEAGVTVIGGHSVDDPEPKFGLAVTGIVHPEEVVHTPGAAPGSDLVLTKALGTGIISSAIKEGEAPWVDAGALDEARSAVLFDAQTSGGLLIAVEATKTGALMDSLAGRGVATARRIGTLQGGSGR